MIEVHLTIDDGDEPVSGHFAAGEDGKRTPFIGYVELISALERARTAAGPRRAPERGVDAQ